MDPIEQVRESVWQLGQVRGDATDDHRKTMYKGIAIMFCLFFAAAMSCKRSVTKGATSQTAMDSIEQKSGRFEQDRKHGKFDAVDHERRDSIWHAEVLKEAMDVADSNVGKDTFRIKYSTGHDSIGVDVDMSLGHLFSDKVSHLMVRLQDPAYMRIHIYAKQGSGFREVVANKEMNLEYVSDTIMDVNGDGLLDFAVETYGQSGCCLKAFKEVYLQQNSSVTFTKGFLFINPTFSPKEHLVRGVEYGHPGETEIYKYRWNGERLDTLEYVWFERDKNEKKTGKVVVSRDMPGVEGVRVIRVLHSPPKEYRSIYGYDWFMGRW